MGINIGFIGYGYWGPNLVRNFNALPDVKVSYICDLLEERLKLAKITYPEALITKDYKALIRDPKIDAIVISTPPSTHFPLAKEAILNGKHLLIEKPMTIKVDEAKELIELSEKQRKVLMVDHTFIYTGAVRKIKEIIEKDEIGNIYYFDSVRVNLGLFQHDVNVIWDLAVHDFSIMDYILGKEPQAISAIGVSHFGNLETMAYITIEFSNNLLGHIHVNWLAPVKVRTVLIGGSKRMIVYDDNEPTEKVKIYDTGVSYYEKKEDIYQILVQYRTGDIFIPKLDATEGLRLVALEFINAINEKRKPLTDSEMGLRIVKFLSAACLSLKQRGKLVKL